MNTNMKQTIMWFYSILFLLLAGCYPQHKSFREITSTPKCAVSFLKISDNLIIGDYRESALMRTYGRPKLRTTADSAFRTSCEQHFTIIPDDTLQRIVGVTTVRDTILSRLHRKNIPFLLMPSITENGELQIDMFETTRDSSNHTRLISSPFFDNCKPISISNEPALQRCLEDQVTIISDSLLLSYFNIRKKTE